jgi:hypothetical protein
MEVCVQDCDHAWIYSPASAEDELFLGWHLVGLRMNCFWVGTLLLGQYHGYAECSRDAISFRIPNVSLTCTWEMPIY